MGGTAPSGGMPSASGMPSADPGASGAQGGGLPMPTIDLSGQSRSVRNRNGNQGGDPGSSSGGGGSGDGVALSGPGGNLPVPGPRPVSTRPPAPRPGWLDRNRDWIIEIECKPDSLELYSRSGFGRQLVKTVPVKDLSSAPNNPMLTAVKDLIDGRQRMVPAGVAPWRPILRFEVHVDSSRSYFLAYSALESLTYTKIRDNLDLDDVRKSEHRNLDNR
jgi:hypothetical protein